ncbi:MAG TPA: hypothetical protein PKA19_04660 [Bacillota bacterium]|nr:hypothetical protein [Bacillota bacterium]
MGKYFIPIAIGICLLSTAVITAVGQNFISRHPDRELCVESRSCAINYMHHLETKENQEQE